MLFKRKLIAPIHKLDSSKILYLRKMFPGRILDFIILQIYFIVVMAYRYHCLTTHWYCMLRLRAYSYINETEIASFIIDLDTPHFRVYCIRGRTVSFCLPLFNNNVTDSLVLSLVILFNMQSRILILTYLSWLGLDWSITKFWLVWTHFLYHRFLILWVSFYTYKSLKLLPY